MLQLNLRNTEPKLYRLVVEYTELQVYSGEDNKSSKRRFPVGGPLIYKCPLPQKLDLFQPYYQHN